MLVKEKRKGDVGNDSDTHTHNVPIPLTVMTIYFVFAVMYLPAKPVLCFFLSFFLTTLFSWSFTHKSHGTLKRCSAVILKQQQTKRRFCELRTPLRAIQRATSENTSSLCTNTGNALSLRALRCCERCAFIWHAHTLWHRHHQTAWHPPPPPHNKPVWQTNPGEDWRAGRGKKQDTFPNDDRSGSARRIYSQGKRGEGGESEADDGVLGWFLNYWEMSVREVLPQFCPGRYEFSAKRGKRNITEPQSDFIYREAVQTSSLIDWLRVRELRRNSCLRFAQDNHHRKSCSWRSGPKARVSCRRSCGSGPRWWNHIELWVS